MKSFLLKGLIPIIIIALGVGGAVLLKNQASQAEHKEPEEVTTWVETVTAAPADVPAELTTTGTVTAARQVTLAPEITGRVIKISKNLVPGSRLKKGDLIARIDKRDFELALTQEETRVQQAAVDLELERGRSAVAAEEWSLISKDLGEGAEASELALRKPQLGAAEQQTRSARSGLQKAQLNLDRTVLRAPFNSIVLEKRVDVGQLVGPNTPVATLMGSDELWVDVSVPVERLSTIDIPGVNADVGSRAKVTQRLGPGQGVVRHGEVIRLQGQLDGKNRTARLIVSIKDPYDAGEQRLPLLAGAFVAVEIEGRALTGVYRIPREALQEGAFVWIKSAKDTLVKSEVQVGWSDRDHVVVTHGIEPGDHVITSPLFFPIEGMAVSVVPEDGSSAARAEAETEVSQ